MKKMRLKQFDLELSNAVREYPCLYDRSDPRFHQRDFVLSCWDSISAKTRLSSGDSARRAFDNLRKRYNKVKGRYNFKAPPDAREQNVIEREIANYSFIHWLDPFIHRRRGKHQLSKIDGEEEYEDDSFDGEVSMVKRDAIRGGGSHQMKDDDEIELQIDNNSESENEIRTMFKRDNDDNESEYIVNDHPSSSVTSNNDHQQVHIVHSYSDDHHDIPVVHSSVANVVDSQSSSLSEDENPIQIKAYCSLVKPHDSSINSSLVNSVEHQMKRANDHLGAGQVKRKSEDIPFIHRTSTHNVVSVNPPIGNLNRHTNGFQVQHKKKRVEIIKPFQGGRGGDEREEKKFVSVFTGGASSSLPKVEVPRSAEISSTSSTTSTSVTTAPLDENDLLARLITTKINRLPRRLKLNCENELLQTLFKYEMMAEEVASNDTN